MKYLLALLFSLVLCVSAQAQTTNTTLTGLANNTALDLGVITCTPTSPGGGCADWTDYSRLIYDRVGHRMLGWGGGHATAFSDSVFSLDLGSSSKLVWTELYAPTPSSSMTVGNFDSTNGAWKAGPSGPYPRPTSTHSVGALTHDPVGNQLVNISIKDIGTFNGAPPGYSGGKYAHYSIAGNSWSFSSAGATFPSPSDEGMPCTYDPISKFIVCIGVGSAAGSIITYDPATRVKTTRIDGSINTTLVKNESGAAVGNDMDYNTVVLYNPHDQNLYYFQRGSPIKVYKIVLNRVNWSSSTITRLTTTNAPSTIVEMQGYAYDLVNGVFGTFGTNTFYYFNWRTKAWASQAISGSPGATLPASATVDYDPVNNVFIYVNGARHTIAYKFANNAAGADFAKRCTRAGVIRCEGFDDATFFDPTGVGHGIKVSDEQSTVTFDTAVKSSGAGSVKYTIPLNCDVANGDHSGFCVGNWELYYNFAEDLSVQQRAGTTTYVTIRTFFGPNYLPTPAEIEQGHGGFKLFAIGEGDIQGTLAYNSCVDLTQSAQNGAQQGFGGLTTAYNVCQGGDPGQGHMEYIPAGSPGFPNADIKLQNARVTPFCTYNQTQAASGTEFPPTGNCWDNRANQWVTYKYVIQVGNIDTSGGTVPCGSGTCLKSDFWLNSRSQLWAARDGQDWELLIDWRYEQSRVDAANFSRPLYRGNTAENKGYGKFWFGPRNFSHWTAPTTMYADELIISTQDIAAPGVAAPVIPDTTPPAAPTITNPVPPTTSTTTSPIAVSGTATDNVGVTSVTWTCIACVTKGGTATGTTSWLIPALDLVAGTNVLNVVSHDAAGNASPAATLNIAYAPLSSYWVRPTGTMSGCTPSTNPPAADAGYKSTITAGVGCLASGSTLFIRAGTYKEQLPFPVGGTGVGSPTIISRYQNEIVTLVPGTSTITGAVTSANSYVIFDGLIFDGTGSSGFSDGLSICCYASGPSFVIFRNGEIKNFDGNGVSLHADNIQILNSSIHNNGSNTSAGPGHGIYSSCHTGCVIAGNHVFDNDHYGIHIYDSGSITVSGHRVYQNTVNGNGKTTVGLNTTGFGLLLSSGADNQAYNNVVYNNGISGQSGGGIQVSNCSTCVVYNNTFYGNANYGIDLYPGASGTLVRNNVSWGNLIGSLIDENSLGLIQDHNYCNSGCTGTGTVNSIASPFISATTGDFHLIVGSTAINAGTPLGFPYNTDFANVPRPQGTAYDIGAYEFVGTIPPVVTIVNPTSNPTLTVASPIFSLGGTSNLP